MDFIAMAETLEAQAASLRREAARIAGEGQAELELAPVESEWITWAGGEQPTISYGKNIDYVMRDRGRPGVKGPADALTWAHDSSAADIVEFRISAEQPATP